MFLFSQLVHKISGTLFSNIMQEIPYYYYIKTSKDEKSLLWKYVGVCGSVWAPTLYVEDMWPFNKLYEVCFLFCQVYFRGLTHKMLSLLQTNDETNESSNANFNSYAIVTVKHVLIKLKKYFY
jgi:hypothetical protein